jgi:SAM-dependent methyltransferase
LWFFGCYNVENEYQNYLYSRHDIAPYGDTLKKYTALAGHLRGAVDGKTFLDLGCDTGFFPLMAAKLGARESVGVDRNARALAKAERARHRLALENVRFIRATAPDFTAHERFDTVLFMSAIHYMFSDKLGNHIIFQDMNALLKYLSGFVKNCLFIEFVKPDDPYIGRLVADRFLSSGEYSCAVFQEVLNRSFISVVNLGKTHSQTRNLFMASGPRS